MDKDYVAVEFSGKDLSEVANKMVLFLNSIKGVNLVNAVEPKTSPDGDRLLQGESAGVHEGEPGDQKRTDKNPK